MMMQDFLRRFRDDTRGSALIETAFVAPFLVLMSLGGVEIANMVKRQHELQNAATKAGEIIIAAKPNGEDAMNALITQIKDKIKTDTGLETSYVSLASDPNEDVANAAYVMRRYRCGNSKSFKKSDGGCTDSSHAREFIVFLLREEYTPVWKEFGFGKNLQYRVEKSVQIG